MVVEPVPSSPASEKTFCSNMMENFQCNSRLSLNKRNKSSWKSSDEFFSNSATKPASSAPLWIFIYFTAHWSSSNVHGVSVRFVGRHGLFGCPAKISPNMCANAFGCGGCCCLDPVVANCMLRSVCQVCASPNCAFNLSVFHAQISCLWFFRIVKVNDLRSWAGLTHKSWNSHVPAMQDFVPWTWLIHTRYQQADQPRDRAVYGVQHQVRPALVWKLSGGPQRSTPPRSPLHEKYKAIFDRNLVVRKYRSICMENPWLSFFLSPVRVTSILKAHGERIVQHKDSQYFTNADSAADHWL